MSQSKISTEHIVVIYENTGGGHLKAAKILQNILTSVNVRITLITASELIKDDNNIFVRGWNYFIRKNWLLAADILFNFLLRLSLLPLYYSIYPKTVATELDKLNPDIIISTGDGNRLFGSYCSKKGIPFFIFITDLSIFVDMLSTHATHLVYFNEVARLIRSFETTAYFTKDITPDTPILNRIPDTINQWMRYSIGYLNTPYFKRYKQSIKQNNNLVTATIGPIREQEYYETKDIKHIKQEYNVPEDGYNIIISNGSLGGITITKIVAVLQQSEPLTPILNLLVICGSDDPLYQSLQVKTVLSDKIRIIPITKQPSLAKLYQIADVSIGRGTAGILLDSIMAKTPLIVLKQVTANDSGSLDIITHYGIGEIADNYQCIPYLLNQLLEQREKYTHAIDSLLGQYKATDYQHMRAHVREIILGISA